MIARLPAAESFRFGFGASGAACCFLDSAHRFRCAAAIAALPALLIFRRPREGGSEAAAAGFGPPSSICRISAIWASIRFFWISNPSIAAVRISVVSFVGMDNSIDSLCHTYCTSEKTLSGTRVPIGGDNPILDRRPYGSAGGTEWLSVRTGGIACHPLEQTFTAGIAKPRRIKSLYGHFLNRR